MKILHLRSTAFFGSPERLILAQCLHSTQGFETEIAVFADEEQSVFVDKARSLGVKVHLLSSPLELRRLQSEESYNLICSHDYKSNFYSLFLLGKNVARVAVFHGRTSHSFRLKTYELLDTLVLASMSKVIAVSEASRMRLSFLGDKKVVVIPNAIDPEHLHIEHPRCWRQELGIADDSVVFCSVGRLSREKNQLLLIRSFARVVKDTRDSGADVHLLLAGDGPIKNEIKREVNKQKLSDCVHFLGHVDEIASVYQSSDIFVLSSISEGMPLSILEAGFFGKAVIATRVGGVEEVINSDSVGLLVDSNDEQGLGQNMSELATDGPLREALSQNLEARIKERFLAPCYAKNCDSLYVGIAKNMRQ